jgi:hypothetical protein
MVDLGTVGRWLLVLGLAIAALGGLLWVVGRMGLPLGRLPGDLRFQSGGVTCFIPLASSLLLSLLLTLALNLLARWLSR